MAVHRINVFVSHSWRHGRHYETLSNWMFDHEWRIGRQILELRDYSSSIHRPILGAPTDRALRRRLMSKIARSHVIVAPTGVYATHSRWIGEEIDCARDFGKPILGVDPLGAQRTSTVVVDAAWDIVGWRASSVILGIWRLYNGR